MGQAGGTKKALHIAFLLAVLTGSALLLSWMSSFLLPYAELQVIEETRWKNNEELFSYFKNIAQNKGGVYAFELLRRANLLPNIDLHLLGHAIGDELYKQKGIDGMADCTQDFRNACSHSIVVGAFGDFGEDALPRIREACSRAPGGSGAYTMCFHGLGHGVFAYWGYDLPAAVTTCARTGTETYRLREYAECVGGIVMELTGGGGHDKALWMRAREKYLTADPLSPCSSEAVPEEVKDICYLYLTPRLFEYAGADLAYPGEKDFSNAFEYCDGIPKERHSNRRSCFGGFGKEFIVLALDRDIRNVESAHVEALERMWRWCSLAPHEEGSTACAEAVAGSLYWGGENAPDSAVSFCTLILEDAPRKKCFAHFFSSADLFSSQENTSYREGICSMVPEDVSVLCQDALLKAQAK